MPTPLSRMVEEAALRRPEAVAVRHDDVELSYEVLCRRANGIAWLLTETGLKPRDRVAVLLRRGLRVPVAFHGVLRSGGVLVPIDPKSPADQLARILRATGATHLVTEPELGAQFGDMLEELPDLSQFIGLKGSQIPAGRPQANASSWETVDARAEDRGPEVETIELDPAYILHTSGSTGIPKLIQHTHRSALSFVDWAVREYSLTHEDKLTNHSSHHTCFATFDYYAAALAGATTVLLTPALLMMPASLSAMLERERVSVWYSVPTALVQLALRGDLESRDLSRLRWILFAGETFPEKHLRRIRDQIPSAGFSHVYGSTETNVCTFYHLPETGDFETPLPIGKACANSSTLVVDANGNELADGEEGELLVRGSTVMSGYWGEPEKNEQVFVRRPEAGGLDDIYFRTGDHVRRLGDGNLSFVARTDLQIKVRGHRVELEEIEAALMSLDSVEAAAAFAVPDGEASMSIRAAVVVEGNVSNEREIRASVSKTLPPHAIPSEVFVVDSLPRTPTGKVDRKALRGRALGEAIHDAD